MRHVAIALLLFAGCKRSATDSGSSPPEHNTPSSAATPAPPPAAKPAEAAVTNNGDPATFAMFSDALTGKRPWLDDAGKRGIVELIAIDDASGHTKGTFKVTRRCGADAVATLDAIGKQFVARAKDHDPPTCSGGKRATMTCLQSGNGEGDTAIEVVYKSDDAGNWQLTGVKTYAMGVTLDAQEAEFVKLAGGSCVSARSKRRSR
jgi:hypothetical protein